MTPQRHTTRIRFLRWFFPLLAVLLLIGAALIPTLKEFELSRQSKKSKTHVRVEEVAVSLPKNGQPMQLQVTNPEFSGQDDQGHPYVVTATKVIQDGMTPGASTMNLDHPQAVLITDEATKDQVKVKASTGVYDPAAKTLQLSGPVTVTNSAGYQLDLQELSVDFPAGSSISDKPVTGFGPNGTLSGESLELRDKGNTIILHGKSKVVLTPKDPE